MGRLIVSVMVSADGYFEGIDGDLSWHQVDIELHEHFNDELRTMRAFLTGRRSYELMAAYWPTADQNPDSAPPEAEFAGIWREMPQLVYSRTLESVGWNASLRREVDPVEIRTLLEEGDLTAGGADLVATLLGAGLVDEWWSYVNPVVIGAGRRPFPDGVSFDLELLETRAFSNGVVLLRHAVSPKVTA